MEEKDISLLVISILGIAYPLLVVLFERSRFVGRPKWILKKNLKEKQQKIRYKSDWDDNFKK